jgi:hypothetical protein
LGRWWWRKMTQQFRLKGRVFQRIQYSPVIQKKYNLWYHC